MDFKKLRFISTDQGTNMVGKNKGLFTLLKNNYTWL
jgi:hypothetical protein